MKAELFSTMRLSLKKSDSSSIDWGQFRRIAGPGPVLLRLGETIEHVIDVRNQPYTVRADNLFIKGIQFNYQLDMWYRTALTECAQSPEELANLAQFSDREREKMVRAQVRDALAHSVVRVEDEWKPPGTHFLFNLLPIVPGFPPNISLLKYARATLEETLRTIGVILTPERPFIISGLSLDQTLGPEFSRDRTVTLLKQQFPGMDEEMYLQAYAIIAGKALPRTIIQSEDDTTVDFQIQEDGQAKPTRARSYGNRNQKSSPTTQSQPQSTAAAEKVLDSDWEVMKKVPAA